MIKVFIIDDSNIVRCELKKILSCVVGIELIGEAENPIDAFEVFKKVGLPDVFILDIEMPKMDGLTFLRNIMTQKPIPVIICSALATRGSSLAVDALRIGAVDIITKPKINLKNFFNDYKDEFIDKIKSASKSKVLFHKIENKFEEDYSINKASIPSTKFIAIGSSTGGVQTLEEILTHLKKNHQGIIIVQHMPEGFTASFAKRLNQICKNSEVIEGQNGDYILNGRIIIAQGGIHTEVIKGSKGYKLILRDFSKVNSHKPSVNVLFKSVAKVAGRYTTGFILTGMGSDGASGLKIMKDVGANTYAQNKKTSIVYGMPKVACEMGAVKESLSIFEITKKINNLK